MLIGGDFNLELDPQIDWFGSLTNNDKSATWLGTHLQSDNLLDPWRVMNPE